MLTLFFIFCMLWDKENPLVYYQMLLVLLGFEVLDWFLVYYITTKVKK